MSKPLDYANASAIKHNPVMALLYYLAYYLALSAKKISLTPNQVTAISFVFVMLAAVSLVMNYLFAFLIFWLVGFLLDLVDGTLARMNDSVEKSALNWDHISDIIKIAVIFLSFGMHFDDTLIWVLSFVSSSLYIFYTVVSHEAGWVRKFHAMQRDYKSKDYGVVRRNEGERVNNKIYIYIVNRPLLKKVALILLTMLLTVNAHTVLIFFLIPLHEFLAYGMMTYFIFLATYRSWLNLRILSGMKKVEV